MNPLDHQTKIPQANHPTCRWDLSLAQHLRTSGVRLHLHDCYCNPLFGGVSPGVPRKNESRSKRHCQRYLESETTCTDISMYLLDMLHAWNTIHAHRIQFWRTTQSSLFQLQRPRRLQQAPIHTLPITLLTEYTTLTEGLSASNHQRAKLSNDIVQSNVNVIAYVTLPCKPDGIVTGAEHLSGIALNIRTTSDQQLQLVSIKPINR